MIFYPLTLLVLTIYSYCLLDPNITFFNNSLWAIFREKMVYLGYYQRPSSWWIYLSLVLLLLFFNYWFTKKYQRFSAVKIALITGLILCASYPFLSHDFFNYMFDAKIFTFYHQNPYLFKALDFPTDPWIRFMHWTHRTYPYGPVFLLITLVPSFLSLGKFLLSFFLFKLTFFAFYFGAVYFLNKTSKKAALFFATNPYVIIEGLVNSHNDLIMIALALMGIYLVFQKKQILGKILILFSIGIKYITAPLLFLSGNKKNKLNLLLFVGQIFLLIALIVKMEIQQWYFLTLFVFLPYFENFIYNLNLFFAGLLFSYYPYIFLGGWDSQLKMNLKHQIILGFFVMNIIYLAIKYNKKICLPKFLKK